MDAAGGSSSVQHGVQLVSQGVKHGADVIQDVLGGGAGGALSLLSANALLRGPQCGCQGRAGPFQSLLGLARAHSRCALWTGRRYRAGAKSGSQLRARKCQLGAGHRHRLGSCSCSRHLDEGSGRSWGLWFPTLPTACRVLQSWPRAGGLGGLGGRAGRERGCSSWSWKAARVWLRRAGRSHRGLAGGLGGHGGRGAGHGGGHSEGQKCRLQRLSLPAFGPPLNSV